MSYYGQDVDWRRAAAVVLAVLALAVFAFKALQPRDVSVRWDSETVNRGDMATLWVTVRNPTPETMDLVVVRVEPVSPYLSVYSDQNASSNIYYIPKLASGAEAIAKFGIRVSQDAYAGDHAVRIFVAMPGRSYVVESKIRVV